MINEYQPKIKLELTLAQLRLIYDHLPPRTVGNRYKELNKLIEEILYP